MKILFFTPFSTAVFKNRFPAISCQRENRATWTENLIAHLSKYKDVRVYLATMSELIDKDYIFEEGRVHYFYLKTPIRHGRKWMLYAADVLKLRKVAKNVAPDLIHAQGTENCYGLAAWITGYPMLISLHAATPQMHRFYSWRSGAWLNSLTERFVLKRTKYVHTQTAYLKDYYGYLLGHAWVKSLDLPANSIFFSVENRAKSNRIVFVGSSLRLKGADTLIKITQLLQKKFHDIEVDIIGSGTNSFISTLNGLALKCGVATRLKFWGLLRPDEIAARLSLAKVFVAPTRVDTYGMSAIEALCAGVPVVSSSIMGVPYVIEDGVNGFLLDPEDVEGFAEKIILLMKNENLRQKMGQKGREIALRRWHPEIVTTTMLEMYQNILKMEQSSII